MKEKEPSSVKALYSGVVLTIVYIVGICGILIPLHPDFIMLTPLNLVFSLYVLLLNHETWNERFYEFAGMVIAFGIGIEAVGAFTGLVFGEYSYGSTLGPKIMGVPFVIGINWLMLVYISGVAANYMVNNRILRAAIAATLMVGLDFLIEPVAIKYNFWIWAEGDIPLQNYIAWWIISFVFGLLFQWLAPNVKNKVAIYLFVNQILFFAILNAFG